jgi:solute carrier family 25 iron transporter 28/37
MYPVDLLKVCAFFLAFRWESVRAHLTDEVGDCYQTRMQILHPSTGGLYTGLTNAVSTIYRIEGWRTLWKGVSSVIVGAGMFLMSLEI